MVFIGKKWQHRYIYWQCFLSLFCIGIAIFLVSRSSTFNFGGLVIFLPGICLGLCALSQWKTIFRPESSEIKDLKDEPLYSRFRAYKIAHKYFFILTIIPVAFIMYYIGFYETNPLNLEDSYYIIRIAIISFFLFMLLSVSLITGVRALKLKKDIGVKKRVISIPLIIIWIILFVFFYLNAAAYFA